MTALKAYRREMLYREPAFGRVVAATGLTTTTAVSTQLITSSGADTSKYTGKWVVRADATTSADRQRVITSYAGATGTLTHTGTNYSDTTATSELLELLEYDPWLYDDAINVSLGRLRRLDREIFPTIHNEVRYWLNPLSWVRNMSDIHEIAFTRNPIINRDRYFEKWNTVNSSGVLQPDWWTISGTSATVTRSTTQNRRTQYTAALLAAGGNTATLAQTVGLLLNGTAASAGEDLRGKTVTICGVGWSDTASQLRFRITDGVTTSNTSYHTGDSTFQELSTTIDVASTATTLTISALVEQNGTSYIDELYCVADTLSDSHRRDTYDQHEQPIPNPWRFTPGPPYGVYLEPRSRGGQYVVYTHRPYPQFDATRLAAGTADADESDAPLAVVAVMAIGRLYESLIGRNGVDERKAAMMAAEWSKRGDELAAGNILQNEPAKGGVNLPRRSGVMRAYLGPGR